MAAITIGLNNMVYAKLLTDTVEGATYETPKKIARAISAGLTPITGSADLYADDGLAETAESRNGVEVEIGVDELPTQVQADLLGHGISPSGGLIKKTTDVSPYVAIGFRSPNSDGSDKLVWLFKGKFAVPSESFATKGENIEFQTPTISARFLRRDFDNSYQYSINTGDEGVSKTAVDSWFTEVADPAEPATV